MRFKDHVDCQSVKGLATEAKAPVSYCRCRGRHVELLADATRRWFRPSNSCLPYRNEGS